MGLVETNGDNPGRTAVLLVIAMLAIAAGHLLVVEGMTTLYLGIPSWLWVHLAVILLLFWLAWIVTGIASPAGRT